MKKRGVSIRYSDVAPEAKENFVPTANESQFDTLAQLQKYNSNFPNYANPCELYQTVLDGTATALPSVPENANIGLWSEQVSGDDGNFAEPVVLTLTSDGKYSSSGFTFTFDKYNQIYPTHINIHWYRGETDLGNLDYYPDNAVYVCENRVERFDKVVITFYSLNMPKNRLKLRVIDYGYDRFFYGDDLRSVSLIQEIDPISSQISINTTDFTLDSKAETEYFFQAKQPLSVYFNGELKSTTLIKTSKRKSKTTYNIQSEDYIGLLDSIPYYGGIYTNARVSEVLTDIFAVAKSVPYTIDPSLMNIPVTGYIPYTTCREALMQVAFAIQAVVDTSNSDAVKVYSLAEETKQTVPLDRIMQGQNFEEEQTVTRVEVASHAYIPISEQIVAYDANKSGTGENIFVKFSEPLHDLSIKNGRIILDGANYAVINAEEGCNLTGQKYEHTKQIHTRDNPLALANELEKVVAIENATLISKSNIDDVLDKCYNWLVKKNKTNLKIIEKKHIKHGDYIKYADFKYGTFKYGGKHPDVVVDNSLNVGDNIEVATEYLGYVAGRIIKQKFNLNGNIVVKDTVLK